jgi:hypothetical protein
MGDRCECRNVDFSAYVSTIFSFDNRSQRCYTEISQLRREACRIREYRWSVRGVGGEMTRSAKLNSRPREAIS